MWLSVFCLWRLLMDTGWILVLRGIPESWLRVSRCLYVAATKVGGEKQQKTQKYAKDHKRSISVSMLLFRLCFCLLWIRHCHILLFGLVYVWQVCHCLLNCVFSSQGFFSLSDEGITFCCVFFLLLLSSRSRFSAFALPFLKHLVETGQKKT